MPKIINIEHGLTDLLRK